MHIQEITILGNINFQKSIICKNNINNKDKGKKKFSGKLKSLKKYGEDGKNMKIHYIKKKNKHYKTDRNKVLKNRQKFSKG